MTASEFVTQLPRRKNADGSWHCRCPAHDDGKTPDKYSLHVTQAGAKVLLKCFAGCEPSAIVKRMGLRLADLMGDKPLDSKPRREVAHYDYHAPDGTLAYQVVRYEPKDFRQRRPDGKGGWLWNMDDVQRVVYHADELVEEAETYWVEGEKDADRLRSLGLQATTSCGGAAAWERGEYIAQLPRTTLYIIPDNDPPGYTYAALVAKAAVDAGLTVKILALPGVPPKGDVSDWLDRGGTVEQLEALATAAPRWTADTPFTPRVEHIGDDWNVVWDHYGATVEFARYIEGRHEIHSEITVSTREHGTLQWQNLNLSSAVTRKSLAKSLELEAPAIPWAKLIERSCRAVVETKRAAQPSQQLEPAHAESVSWVIPPLLPRSEITVLFGDGGVGKSLMAMAVAIAVSTNRDLTNGMPTDDAGAVLYLDWESTAEDAGVRERGLLLGYGHQLTDAPPIRYLPMIRPVHDELAQLRREISLHRVKLVVIDSLGPAMGADPESGETAIRTMGALRALAPATILVIAHMSKQSADQAKGLARPYGSVFVMNLARNVWQANRVEDAPTDQLKLGLFHRKVNLGPKSPNMELTFRFDPTTEAITLAQSSIADPELLARTSVPNQILTALNTGPKSLDALHEELALSKSLLRAHLGRLLRGVKVLKLDGIGGKRGAAWALPTYRVPSEAQGVL